MASCDGGFACGEHSYRSRNTDTVYSDHNRVIMKQHHSDWQQMPVRCGYGRTVYGQMFS